MTLSHTFPNGRKIWKCDCCGKKDCWQNGPFRGFFSIADAEAIPLKDLLTACSDKCEAELKRRLKSGEITTFQAIPRGYQYEIKGERSGY